MKRLWLIGLGVLMTASLAGATPMNYTAQLKAGESKYQRPEDMLDIVPFLSEIPRTYLFGGGYRMKLNIDSLRIDHMGYRSSHKSASRDCMIGFSYTSPVAGFFTSRVDLPLFQSATLVNPTAWTQSSLGDYVAYFSKGASESRSLRFVVSAKF